METVQIKRQEWIDFFKAITIILVVVGHATGKFNMYIYQFHVAAFFFISGWVAKLDKDDIIDSLVKKICSLIMPLFTMVLLFALFSKLCITLKIDRYILDDSCRLPLVQLCDVFWRNGTVVSFLGASWFVIVLFFTAFFSHILYRLLQKKILPFAIITVIIYVLGYYRIKSGAPGLLYGIDRIYIAQGYYGVAFCIKNVLPELKYSKRKCVFLNLILFGLSTFVMIQLTKSLGGLVLMDLAGRRIDHLGWSTIAVCNGIIWLLSLSKLLSYVNIKCVKKVISSLGQNTLGIMFLHFVTFKITAFMLYKMGEAPLGELLNMIPSPEVSNTWWLLYSTISIILSWVLWIGLKKIPIISSLLGDNKSFINKVFNSRIYKNIKQAYNNVFASIANGFEEFKKTNLNLNIREKIICIILSVVCIFGCIGCAFIPSIKNNSSNQIDCLEGKVSVEFPNEREDINFDSGWLPQGEGENYRWVEQNSTFKIKLSNQTKITLTGYVPDNVEGISSVELYLNDELISVNNISSGDMILIEGDLSNRLIVGENIFAIKFDAIRIPTDNDMDQRAFSAMFNSILIE